MSLAIEAIGRGRSTQSGGAEPGDSPVPLAVGSVLRERFVLLEIVGRGSMSTVFRALDRIRVLSRAHDPEVALKVVVGDGALELEAVEGVHREARYLQDLVHANIVRGFDSDRDGLYHFVVMELLRGRTVTKILRETQNNRLSTDTVVRIIGEVAAGLSFAHAKGVIHGDLKPSNVFLTFDGDVKLLDFGAARAMDDSPAGAKSTRPADGVNALTPLYASPEMIAGEPPTERDDVFSLAVLAYVMLTGRHPFDGKTAAEARERRMAPQPASLAPSRSRALQSALALEASARTASVAAFAEGFARVSLRDRLFG